MSRARARSQPAPVGREVSPPETDAAQQVRLTRLGQAVAQQLCAWSGLVQGFADTDRRRIVLRGIAACRIQDGVVEVIVNLRVESRLTEEGGEFRFEQALCLSRRSDFSRLTADGNAVYEWVRQLFRIRAAFPQEEAPVDLSRWAVKIRQRSDETSQVFTRLTTLIVAYKVEVEPHLGRLVVTWKFDSRKQDIPGKLKLWHQFFLCSSKDGQDLKRVLTGLQDIATKFFRAPGLAALE